MPRWLPLLANALWLQAGWWGCVLGAQRPPLLAAVAVGLLLHLALCRQRRAEGVALVSVGLAGCALDAALGLLGVFDFHGALLPPWLALLWLVFASGLRHSLAWAAQPAWRGALFGALGGPLAYAAGAPLAGVGLPLGLGLSVLLLALLWAVWLPLMLRLALRC
ncbi:hypothetical protein HNP46_000987 [Pseudomonas nitritireducens]|uniref:DUF2878 domain-containing protein n=1 Tax=Pseudomonas nitroreducens TaxID=46680 RepID=A0A7W7KH27_PSENT|nr:DUF2878 domain-containing protein [Pseudomonas nitritireducens]MBB4862149.1 hypothetical protein [Pseudomonas nitritireducens]